MFNGLFKKIGETLVERNLLSKKQVSIVLRAQLTKYSNQFFCQIAAKLGFISDDIVLQILSELYSIKPIKMEFLYIPQDTLNLLGKNLAILTLSIPFYADDSVIKIATTDPGNVRNMDRIIYALGYLGRHIEFFVAKESEILRLIEFIKCSAADDDDKENDRCAVSEEACGRYEAYIEQTESCQYSDVVNEIHDSNSYTNTPEYDCKYVAKDENKGESKKNDGNNGGTTALASYNLQDHLQDPLFVLNKIIFEALEAKASDIHFEPTENFVEIRFRIDGILQKTDSVPFDAWNRIKSKLKIISRMDITESRKAQNGHARIYLGGRNIDLRIATVCGSFGENITIRIFDLNHGVKNLVDLGFRKKDFLWLKNIISHPYGIFLIVGPTGSGKTTTLYSLVEELKSPTINIVTLEDPIEYQIDGIRQLELREDGLMSFADGIKTVLRHDPDVLLVGEIRDEETAAAAVRASLTGRLVLSTLHASTPTDALRRLVDLGLKLSDFVPSLLGIFSQRLLRYREKKGRFPVTEYMSFSDETRKKLLCGSDIEECIPAQTFKASAKQALKDGITDRKEIQRVFGHGFL